MSFTQGLSGLNAAQKQLEVVGNNVANANTVGFKGSQAQFGDVFAAALSGAGAAQIGIGSRLLAVAQQFTQGNISVTNNTLDMAVNGPGFFVLSGVGGTGYSRNGQFQLDKNGFIVSAAGDFLQGYPINSITGQPTTGATQALTVPTAVASAAATGSGGASGAAQAGIIAGLNLDSRSLPAQVDSATGKSSFSPTDPTTFNNSTSTTTYDSKGVAQTTTMYFVKSHVIDNTGVAPIIAAGGIAPGGAGTTITPTAGTIPAGTLTAGQTIQGGGFPTGATIASVTTAAGFVTSFDTTSTPTPATSIAAQTLTIDVPNSWDVYTTVTDPTSGSYLFPSPALTAPNWVANGILTFTTGGRYNTFTANPNAPAALGAGVTAGTLNTTTSITLYPTGASTETIPFDFSAATQFGSAFGVTQLTQDGYTAGQLSGFSIGADGIIQGRYSNGVTQSLGQVALATFPNMQGLQPLGNNLWAESSNSGAPVVNAPGAGNNGVLQTSSTEDSNVDLTAELVNMITAQRVYQANAQTIKTQDSVMQTLVNLR